MNIERIEQCIYFIHGERVMLDSDLASLYGVPTKVLVQAVKRNLDRFPPHFMFQLSLTELTNWRSQIVTSNSSAKMGLRRPPYAFTEQGVAMLSSVLRSKQAIRVNIAIMDTFVRIRRLISTNIELAHKLDELDRKVVGHDEDIRALVTAIRRLMESPSKKRSRIGFRYSDT